MTEDEPRNDDELRRRLRAWRAPEAPERLDARVLAAYRSGLWKRRRWWRWLLTGSVRVPLPVAAGVALLCAASLLAAVRRAPTVAPGAAVSAPSPGERSGPPAHEPPAKDLTGFEPMKEMKVTILSAGDVR